MRARQNVNRGVGLKVMSKRKHHGSRPPTFARQVRRFRTGARNALTWMRKGRLGAPYQAPFDVVLGNDNYQLRRYFRADEQGTVGDPVLLIPPLMVTSEIYDISPELSSVSFLTSQGLDVWLTDFGRPELTDGGMERTLDDHLLAVDNAIDEISARTGKNVHLLGYSQGGMFAYQVAAYRKSKKIASVVTFGSPVDIHRSLPGVKDSLAGRFARVARKALERPLKDLMKTSYRLHKDFIKTS